MLGVTHVVIQKSRVPPQKYFAEMNVCSQTFFQKLFKRRTCQKNQKMPESSKISLRKDYKTWISKPVQNGGCSDSGADEQNRIPRSKIWLIVLSAKDNISSLKNS